MFDRLQNVTCRPSEFRVQEQHVDCELNLVNDSLAGAMSTRKEFEVTNQVVLAVAVAMMNSFIFVKLATKMLLHHITVFKHRSNFAVASQHRNGNPNVTVFFDVPLVVSCTEPVERTLANRFVTTFRAAIFLFGVDTATRFAAFFNFFSAGFASKNTAFSRIFSAPQVRTWARAVYRILGVFLAIRVQIRPHHSKRFAALFARKTNDLTTGSDVGLIESFGASADVTAKTSLVARVAKEGLPTILTRFLNRHGLAPLLGSDGILAVSIGNVK